MAAWRRRPRRCWRARARMCLSPARRCSKATRGNTGATSPPFARRPEAIRYPEAPGCAGKNGVCDGSRSVRRPARSNPRWGAICAPACVAGRPDLTHGPSREQRACRGPMLQTLLAEGRPLLADGATGTNLFAMGLTSGDSPELWNAVHPDRAQALHRAFVDAGSDIILTNSFGANRRRLMLHGLEARTRELNRLAAQNAHKVADSAGRPVVVAGSVGPTGDLIAPLGPLSEDE